MRISSAHVAYVTFIIPGLLFLRHSKLVVVLMRYIDITLLDAW